MRRLDLIIDHIRRAIENVSPSTTDGINTLEIVQYLNEAQDMIYSKIVADHPRAYIKESNISLVASQESYDLPSDIYLGTKLMMVEYKYGNGDNEYYKLYPRTLHDRLTTYESNTPEFYIRRGDDILINPIPQSAKTDGLRINYQRQLRVVDARRGVISTASKTGDTLDSITLDLTPTLGKDDDSVQAAADLLNKGDYICIVDKDGDSVVDSIPIKSYDSSTGVITPDTFTTTVLVATMQNKYITAGKLSTTHSELPSVCERYLIGYAIYKLLRRNANQVEAELQRRELKDMERDILQVFSSPDDDIYRLPIDEDWL